jgi:bifunctional UDP-N-acetylglucosamine pyrophosphorylase/glucosamine-1-phosphate N-acetyltransferase
MGKPLIMHNLAVVNEILNGKIDSIVIPHKFPSALRSVQEYFPDIEVTEENRETEPAYNDGTRSKPLEIPSNNESFEIPMNAIVRSSDDKRLFVDHITYPWEFLQGINNMLQEKVTKTVISPRAKISQRAIIEGPCVIEDDVTIDDFCKIKGPSYISKGSFIGMSSLIRNSMIGDNTTIGFNCEIARTYFAGPADIAHQNVILDSIIGKNVWFGGYSAAANVRLTKDNVKYEIDGKLVDTGINHFGTVVGNNSSIGAYVLILPGRQIPRDSMVQAGTIYGK